VLIFKTFDTPFNPVLTNLSTFVTMDMLSICLSGHGPNHSRGRQRNEGIELKNQWQCYFDLKGLNGVGLCCL